MLLAIVKRNLGCFLPSHRRLFWRFGQLQLCNWIGFLDRMMVAQIVDMIIVTAYL
jgi:hypothetical protein